jgi:hypothetical protein
MAGDGLNKLVGFGSVIAWDSTGGTDYVSLATVVDGDKFEAVWATADTTFLSEKAKTCAKTEYDPGTMKFTIAYFPGGTEYDALKTAFLAVNAAPPSWQITFANDNEGAGSGLVPDTFSAHVVGLSRELKKKDFLVCEITLKLYGGI